MSRIDKVFKDYRGRRIAFIKAFTSEFDDFFHQCDPEKDNLMLYGHPNNKWELRCPAYANVISQLPEPVLGINGAIQGVKTEHWLCLVAAHSDSWLLAVAYFFAGRFTLDRADRERLFDMINNLPTLLEIVLTECKDKPAESTSTSSSNNKKPNSTPKPLKKGEAKCQDTPKSMVVSNSDEEKSTVENVGTCEVSSCKKQKVKKSEVPDTSQSGSSASVVRVVDNCTDLASDPTMKPAGPKTFSQARPCTR